MVRLPSSADVPTVSPRVTADPGVQAPAAAFETPLGTAAQELQPVAEKFIRIKQEQDTRRDTVDRAGLINQFTEESDNERRRLETEEDFSSPDILSGYGGFNSKLKQDLLDVHVASGASADSQARLEIRLGDIESKATGTAAGISTKLGRDKIDKLFRTQLSSLGESASADPSIENLNTIISKIAPEMIDDFGAALGPSQEQVALDTAREFAVTSAVEPMLRFGRTEEAENLLINGGMNRFLSREKQLQLRDRIATIRFNRDKTAGDLSEREIRTQQLVNRGFPLEISQDIAAKDVRIVGPDELGNFFSVNVATGVKTKLEEDVKQTVLEILPPEAQPEEQPESEDRTLGEAVEVGTGPFAKVQAGLSNLLGPFMEGQIFKDTTDARQQIRIFSQTAKTALINNPKFPVKEQEIVSKLLPDADTFFIDPDRSRSDLNELKNALEKSKASKEKESKKKLITSKKRGALLDQISGIDEILTLMEEPEDAGLSEEEQRELEELRSK